MNGPDEEAPTRRSWLRAQFESAARLHRQQGPAAVWFGALAVLGYRRLLLIEHPLDPLPVVPAERAVEIASFSRDATPEPVEAVTRSAPGFRSGDRCFVALAGDGAVLHHCWVVEGGTAALDYLGAELDLAPGVVFVHAAYTQPEARGDNLSSVRAAAMLRHYAERGFSAATAAILPENRAGLRSPMKVGYRSVGRVGCLGSGRLRRTFLRAPSRLVTAVRPAG